MLCSGRDAIGDRNSPASFSDTVPSLKSSPPDIFEWLLSSLSQEKVKFPLLAGLSSLAGQNNPCANVVKITQLYECLHSDLRHILDCIMRVNFTSLDLECLPFGVSLPLREALSSAKSHPDLADSKQLYELIEDFGFYPLILEKQSKIPAVSDSFTGTELEDDEVSSLKFRHDDRVEVVQRIMSCNQAPTLSAKVTADLTEEAIKSEQQAVLLHLSNKIFALTIGRSIFTFSSAWPAGLSEMAKFPEITVSAKLPPLQELIVLDPGTLALDFFDWPHFHNGVAAGLRIPADSAHVTANWIIQNIPSTQNGTTSSAEFGQAGGFALAMGLSGHLKKLEQWQHLLFLQTQQHTITVGSLLGIAASCVETGDKFATKVLGVHIPRMMDPDALAALNEGEGAGGVGSIVVQFSNGGVAHTAAVFGIGLVHLGTGRRKFVELLLEEIGAGDYFGSGDNAEAANSGVSGFNERVKNREGHGVAAGIGLGMVLLGKGGSNMQNLEGVNLVEKLTEYIGSKRVHGKEYGGSDISAAGATIALGLIFLKSENQVVAGILRIPETSHMLDYVRSDLLMIRTLSRNLIMWKNIKPSEEWVESQIPSYIRDCYSLFETDDGSFESHRHAMHHIVAGACLSIAMKFAGSMDSNALRVVVSYLDRQKDAVNFPGVIMAGSGDPNVLRRLHQMSDEVSNNMNYGSHMALQMSLGFLFLGGGRGFTLGTSNNCIAALVCALYPRFPVSSNDNSCHLQALRHFWVFAVDRRRSLISRDVESGSVCVLPISIKLNSSVERIDMWTPCILPDLDTIESVDVFSERYFPVSLKTGLGSSKTDGFTTSQTLFVKRRAGHLDYSKDPKGQKSIFSRLFASKDESLTLSYSEKNPIMNESDEFLEFILTSFSQDPRVLAFAQQFCVQWGDATKEDCEFSKFCTTVLLECLENDSVESPEIYLQLYLLVKNATKLCDPVALYNLAIIDRFYSESSLISEHWISSKPRLVNPLFLESVLCRLDDFFSNQSVDGPFNDLSDLKLTLAPHAEKQGDVSWSDVYQATELDWDGVQNLVAGTEFRLAAAAKVYKKLFSERERKLQEKNLGLADDSQESIKYKKKTSEFTMNEASNADAGPGTRGSALQSPKSMPNSSSDTQAEVEVREILPVSIESATTAESELPVPMTSENSIFSDGSFTGAQMRWAEEAENEASFSKSGIASASKNLAQSDHQAGASSAPPIGPKTSPFQHRTPLREIIARTHRVRTPEIPSSNSIGSIRAEKQRRRFALHSSRTNADHEKLNTKDHWEKTPPLKQSDSRKRLRNLFASHGGRKIEDLLKKSKNETVTDSSTLSKTEKLITAESTANSITDQELLAFIDEGQLEISNDASGKKLPSPTAKRKELADRGSTESYLVPSADEYHERKTTIDIECANGGKKALEVGFRMADDQLNLAADMFLSLANGRVTGAGQCLESDSKVPASGFKTGRGKNLGELTPRQEAFAKALFTECDEIRPQIDAANGDKAQENNPSVKTPELVTVTSTATATLSEPMGKSKYHLVTTKASSKPFITPFKSPLTLSGTANSNVTPSGKPWRTSHVVSLIKTTRAGIIPSDAPPMNTPIRQFGQKPFKIPSSTNKSSTTTPGTMSRCEKPSSAAASKIVFFDIHEQHFEKDFANRDTPPPTVNSWKSPCMFISDVFKVMDDLAVGQSDRGTWGWRDAAFDLHVRGAKVSVASEAWTSNHYRWIVWKFASKARAFPELWKENFFCRENVVNELLYRYQIEYCEGKRSCLKKVFEGDQIAEALMILCVADILVDGVSVSESGIDANGFSGRSIMLELTDGWYAVKSQLDVVLRRAVENEKIVIGQKLMIFGAQAIGSVGSYSPLEAGSKILLGIHGNSTRIATWDAKLGNQRTSFPFQVSIASAKPDGGPLPLVDCIIERVFPLSYVEGQQKRSQLEEDEQMRKYEKLFQDECDKVVSDLTKSGDIDETTDIRQIVVERIGKREVSTMLKIRISDYLPDGCDLEDTCSRTVTIWNPDPHMLEMLQEGLRVKFVGLLPDAWGKGGGTCNFKLGPKRQLFPVATTPAMIAAKSTYVARRFVAIREIEGFITNQEFDAIGVVLSSTESRATLTDESLMLLNVQCYNGELRVVKTGDIISLKNLVYQHGSGSQFYSHFRKGFGVIGAALSASEKERRVELNSFWLVSRFSIPFP
ncbi:Anaphase-promoting complex subunit 1 [Entophlyctis luteolus]|nr:Anaphase-promoting complex subunit 1 [Entophlyctis luteolus]